MRRKKEFIGLGIAVAIALVVIVFMVVIPGPDEAPIEPPEPLPAEQQVDAPEEVANPPPSATGDIDTP